jgi:hypothetical protein
MYVLPKDMYTFYKKRRSTTEIPTLFFNLPVLLQLCTRSKTPPNPPQDTVFQESRTHPSTSRGSDATGQDLLANRPNALIWNLNPGLEATAETHFWVCPARGMA